MNEYHALNVRTNDKIIFGYLIPIKCSERYILYIKESKTQIYHYKWFNEQIKKLVEVLNDVSLETSNYECIPRFRFLESEMTLFIPDNFTFNEMTLSQIIRDIGFNSKIDSIKIEKTNGESLREIEGFKISKRVIIHKTIKD